MTICINDKFPIPEKQESVRLIFVKESTLHRVWHICDMAMGGKQWGNTLYYIALHGHPVEAGIVCTTVLQIELRDDGKDYICRKCLDEFEIAKEIIEQKKMVKFS